MGTTSRHGLPYPESTDLVIQGDDAIQALAEAVDSTLEWTTKAEIAPAESSAFTVGGTTDVDFNGAMVLSNFTYTDRNLTYTGPTTRTFIVSASVEVITGGSGLTAVESTVYIKQDGVDIVGSHDSVQFSSGGLNQRVHTHNVTVPTILAPGGVIDVHVFASPAASIGVSSLDIYPIGPA